jgi:KaiC/GvpD/RAD55 family RecA-like ATPase
MVKKKMDNEEFISTGIESLDRLLEGGIPKGYTTLILGVPGSGMEILAKQLATVGKTLYFSTDETKDKVLDTMRKFGWSTEDIEIVDIASAYSENILRSQEERIEAYKQRSKIDLKELISKSSYGMPSIKKSEIDFLALLLTKTIEKLSPPEKTIINSLDFFLNHYPEEEVFKVIHALKMRNMKFKKTLFLIMTKGIHTPAFERKMEVVGDCVIELEVVKRGSSFDRYLSIKKMRNYARKIGIASYTIEKNGFVLETIERIM